MKASRESKEGASGVVSVPGLASSAPDQRLNVTDGVDLGRARVRCSVLFPDAGHTLRKVAQEAPDFFHDLNLDPVVEAIIAGRKEYNLAPFFRTHLSELDAVTYRQEVMQDMEAPALRQAVRSFAEHMRTMRQRLTLTANCHHRLEQQRWFLAAAEVYTDGIESLGKELRGMPLASLGMRTFREELSNYRQSGEFRELVANTRDVVTGLAAIRYSFVVRNGGVTVRDYEGESDYSESVEETFRKFRQGAVKDYRHKFAEQFGMNHVEAQILDRVALLNPDAFRALERFWTQHANFVDSTVAAFDREIQFYAAYLDYIARFRRENLMFCYPQFLDQRKDIYANATFDVALGDKLLAGKLAVVTNDFFLQGAERVLVITGPNQGGKTTFARTFGQIHFLASLGCAVPGRDARLFLYDKLFTHFEREEDIATLRGKLEDDLVRMRRILDDVTPDSILIINEIFSSTSLQDAVYLGREVLSRITRMDLLCVCVTFLEELAALNEKTVSMVSAVDPNEPARRTFKIERKCADGLAYALAIAEKHCVTYRWLMERIRK